MSHLTVEAMNQINFLLTEVSLECLGNKFFDVYGNQTESLLQLISANTLKSEPTNADTEKDLWKTLTIPKKRRNVTNIVRPVINEPIVTRKRRASFSDTNKNESDGNNDNESLLVPMIPKTAKIAKRRQTIAVQFDKSPKPTTSHRSNKNLNHTNDVVLVSDTNSKRNQKQSMEKATRTRCSYTSIPEIQNSLRKGTDERKYN